MSKKLQIKKSYKFLVKGTSFILDLLGCKYIWYKFNPYKIPKGKEPRTITLWLISIMVALFTIASSRYELELTRLEYRVSNLIMQAESSENVLSFIPALQKRIIPYRPSILNPWSVIKSLISWFDTYDNDIEEELQNIIVKKKHKLANLNLGSLVLVNKNLSRANFQASNLNDATLYRNDLAQANFKYAKLMNTNFAKSYLVEANFSYSDLAYTDFSQANLRNASLRGSSIVTVNFTDALLIGADLSNTDLNNVYKKNMRGAKYNSTNIRLGNVMWDGEWFTSCAEKKFLESAHCQYAIAHEIVHPTKFPAGFNPKEHGMIDVSKEVIDYKVS